MALLRNTLLALAGATVLALAIYDALTTPEVYYSWQTKQCVYVKDWSSQGYTCDNLPNRYIKHWSN